MLTFPILVQRLPVSGAQEEAELSQGFESGEITAKSYKLKETEQTKAGRKLCSPHFHGWGTVAATPVGQAEHP